MATRRRRTAPHLPSALVTVDDCVLAEGDSLSELHITGVSGDADAPGVEISACRISGVSLIGGRLDRARITDTVFERCDLSVVSLLEASIVRTTFTDCRLNGAVMSLAELRDVCFEECRMAGLELRMAHAERSELVRCDLAGADFYAARLPGIRCLGCDLTGAECSQSVWSGGLLHGSILDDIAGAGALRDVTISSAQIVPLAVGVFATLGITVDDDPPEP